jgi:GTP-binding protein Era
MNQTEQQEHKSAFVALIGRPSAGKSTLMNALVGQKVAITSPIPQTTRNAIRGILTRPIGQLVFIDTPGINLSERKMNQRLRSTACKTLEEDADLALYVLDACRAPAQEEVAVARALAAAKGGALVEHSVALINKIDAADAAGVQKARLFLREYLPTLPDERVFSASALTGAGLDGVLARLYALAPMGPPYYDGDCYTDQDARFRVAEIVREKCMRYLHDELPHCLYVEVDATLVEKRRLECHATIYVERESQKGIVVGVGGAMVGRIRMAAAKDLRRIFDWAIALDIVVKVRQNWRANDAILNSLL